MNFLASGSAAPTDEPDYLTLFNPVPQGDYVAGNVYQSRGTSEPDILKAVTVLERVADQAAELVSANGFLRGL